MGWTASTFSLVVFGGALVALGVGLATLRERPDPMAWPIAVMLFAVAAWAIPKAISFGYASVGQVAFWTRMRYPGTVVAPVAYLVVAIRYAGHERWLSRRTYLALAVVPALTVVAVWTNPDGLFWHSLSLVRVGDASVLRPAYGPWYWVDLGYLYAVTTVGLLVLAAVAIRSGPVYRKQAGLMFLGGLIPLAANVVSTLGVGPIDFTTTALALSGLTFAVVLFPLDLLDVRPVARARLVEELDDGVVVIGPDGRVRDFNATARRVLEGIELDRPAAEVVPAEASPDGGELVVDHDGETRRFRTRSTDLVDGRGRAAGRIIQLNDVTDLVEREQRISVLNRILRHNVRNEMNVVIGALETLDEEATGADRERVGSATRSARRVVALAEKAREIERLLQASDAAAEVSARTTVERVVSEARERFPDADVEAAVSVAEDADPAAPVRVVDGDLFETALAELVENAVVHNDRDVPQVRVRVASEAERVRVQVADDGVRIPDHETAVLTARRESDLDHGSGLGLWLVNWTVSLSAGDLSFESNDPRGNVVTATFPTPGAS